ncbi:MAG: alanine--glyoxylate aminotransferase family protein [Bacteroidia bacterium]|nr:alanine--glyoxylate aminotransferase family protein [Bacteroidia bacterium]
MVDSTSRILLTPGPVAVPDFVLEAMRHQVIHHRSAEFRSFFAELQNGLQYVFQTQNQVLALPGSGSFGVETGMRSLFQPGDSILIPVYGKFSARWVAMARTLGLDLHTLEKPWGEFPTAVELKEKAQTIPHLKGVILTHCETSTGVNIDLEDCVSKLRQVSQELLVVADVISTAGIVPLYFDAWKLDLAVAASQKTLLNPAGTIYVAVSDRAKGNFTSERHAAHFGIYADELARGNFPYTAPVQLFYGVKAAVEFLRQKSLPVVWNEVHQRARKVRAEIVRLGGELVGACNGDSLTVFHFPGINSDVLKQLLSEEYQIEVSGAQDGWKGKYLRVAHFGWLENGETEAFLHALQQLITDLKDE